MGWRDREEYMDGDGGIERSTWRWDGRIERSTWRWDGGIERSTWRWDGGIERSTWRFAWRDREEYMEVG